MNPPPPPPPGGNTELEGKYIPLGGNFEAFDKYSEPFFLLRESEEIERGGEEKWIEENVRFISFGPWDLVDGVGAMRKRGLALQ